MSKFVAFKVVFNLFNLCYLLYVQLIALLHTAISYKELKTSKVLVLCPKSTVMNWADEIERWLGPLKPKYYTFNDTS